MIPLFKPYIPQDLQEISDILHSGLLSYGEYGRHFEDLLKKYIGCEYLLTTNTYTNAINIALATLDLKQGDEVITSPMSCLASNQPLLAYGLRIRWADIDVTTGTLSPTSVREQITTKTKVIFHNHFCGYPGYIDDINAIGNEFGITVIDDCVEAFGSMYKRNIIGKCGTDISVFSFQTVRLPNTIDGGAVSFGDKVMFEKAQLIRDLGIDRKKFRDENGEISTRCDVYLKGYAATMSDVNSYIGIQQMKTIQELFKTQQRNAERWKLYFEQTDSQPLGRKETTPNYWVYGILSKNKMATMFELRKNGFYSSGVHLPNNYYSVFRNKQKLAGVDEFYSKFLAVPCGWWFNK